jgi:uncharacterized protein (DUF305 family)
MAKRVLLILRVSRPLLAAGLLLLSNCRSKTNEEADVHQPGAPATMMAALHTMAEHSQALLPGTDLDLYFARLMRENHRAAVSMSALELQQGHDPELRRIAQDIHRVHQLLVLGLDSAISRIDAQPAAYHDHTPRGEQLSQLLEAATAGLHPAAHRSISQVEAGTDSIAQQGNVKEVNVGTGSVDHDYAALLVPHHQNSLTLARAELALGRDEPLQRAAYFILRDQQREIEQVQAWLSQHPRKGN